ncbi:hypothetical protein [Mycolicibacterium rhodesiae]|uniref:Uncharacterized protein n=1 Tax=Mycolicibacterium rhodesiae TaxID=36814 RepID=A0A1X0IJ99_MYCRH|nr:hypothetical protein [Mycolicibacterium rhodesiae]MCV7342964.1 hypothetical protein [Mycolicibacterium rhodesiae]ORB47762.1 hypothetical protein BST42_27010 [Mycolicibacterium rhodesiae]
MNVGDSVTHALREWGRSEWDAAMLHACNAVDGTGKKRYPNRRVGARFKRTIRDSIDIFGAVALTGLNVPLLRFPVAVKSDLPDKRPDVADVIYGIHRCTHGHGDELPEGFELTPIQDGGDAVNIRLTLDGKLQLPTSVVMGLLAVAIFAPENNDQVIGGGGNYGLTLVWQRLMVNDWWGRGDDFRELVRLDQAPSGFTVDFGRFWNDWKPV